MNTLKLSAVVLSFAAFSVGGTMASANEGNAIGQNDLLLAATRCGNNGGGNDAEILLRTKEGLECLKNVELRKGEDNPCDVDPTERPAITVKIAVDRDGNVVAAKCIRPRPPKPPRP